MTPSRSMCIVAAAALAVSACGADAGADPSTGSNPYEDGDVVTLLVGQEAGGGFDTLARILQPSLEEALRDETGTDVRVQVVNRPGGNNVVAAQEVYKAAPDGETIYIGSSERMVEIDVFQDNADFELESVTPLGILGFSNRGLIVRKELGIPENDFAALVEYAEGNDVRLASPGAGERLAFLDELLTEAGAVPTGLIHVGLSGGTGDYVAGLLRGDVDAVMTTAPSLGRYVDENPDELQWTVNFGCERDEALADVPTVVEQDVANGEKICGTLGSYARSFIGPPGMEGERLSALRAALEVAASSEQYREAAANVGDPPSYQTPEQEVELFEQVVETYSQYQEVLDVE